MSLPTLTDLKIHLDITRDNNDDELNDMLDAAVDVVEGIIGPVGPKTVAESHYLSGVAATLMLRQMPVTQLVSVSSRSGAESTPLALTDYELDAAAGLVRRVDGCVFAGSFTVTYSLGRPTVPAAIRLAILVIAAHLWETQRGTSPSALALQGGDVADFPTGQGYAIPNRARELLAQYVQISVA